MDLACFVELDRSHRRHDDVMEGLLAAARRLAAGRPDSADVDTVRDAINYFSNAVTRHFLDEEGSVFPRLSTRRPELAAELAALSAEHPTQVTLQNAVAEVAKQLDGDSRQNTGKTLLEVAERLAAQHHDHATREDGLFAAAKDALTAEDDAEIVAEMEMRRDRETGVHLVSPKVGSKVGSKKSPAKGQLTTHSAAKTTSKAKPAKAKPAAKPAKKSAPKKTAKGAKKSAAKKPTAKKSAAKKSPAKKSKARKR